MGGHLPGCRARDLPGRVLRPLQREAIAFNECMRRAIMLDPNWRQGDYHGGETPAGGLPWRGGPARSPTLGAYHGGDVRQETGGEETALEHDLHARFDVERYLHEEGKKLVNGFDPNSYLYVTRAIDLHDISRGYESLDAAYRRILAEVLLIGIRSDILFDPKQIRRMAERMRRAGVRPPTAR